MDNGSSHRGQAAIDRLAEQFPNAVMVHTPVHASWLNQIEIFFSVVQRKVFSLNNFTGTDEGAGSSPVRWCTTSSRESSSGGYAVSAP
ncbi:transposase [Rhodococcus sp. WAY2]|uniref:transposase n=1 Tax=Rhodococcus sp. WAY2 TaxID=2663121 RepID=UPI002E285207|nr:transposase [Rhodococcus sp. WAY2]